MEIGIDDDSFGSNPVGDCDGALLGLSSGKLPRIELGTNDNIFGGPEG